MARRRLARRLRRRFDLDVSGALLPFYTSGVVGFSGVNYAFRAVACHRRPRNQIVLVFGIVRFRCNFPSGPTSR